MAKFEYLVKTACGGGERKSILAEAGEEEWELTTAADIVAQPGCTRLYFKRTKKAEPKKVPAKKTPAKKGKR